ncbi:MAG: DUF5655 domain-containing protein [Bacteroidota bacterium]
MCVLREVGELFLDKPDEMVLAYDDVLQIISKWQPNTWGASVSSIVFTSKKAWLIIKPMKKWLDIKFYHDEEIRSDFIAKVSRFGKKHAYHIRVSRPEELNEEIFELLKMGFAYSLR